MAPQSSAARAIALTDLAAARTLLAADPTAARYLDRARSIVEEAVKGKGDHLALVTGNERELRGIVLFGPVAGSDGAAAIKAVTVLEPRRRRGVASALIGAACNALQARGARLVVAELADDPVLAAAHGLLAKCGFSEGGRVKDFYGKGTDLVILERRLTQ